MIYISDYRKAFINCIEFEFSKEKLKEIAEREKITVDGYKQRAKKYYNLYASEEEKKVYDKAIKVLHTKLSFCELKSAFDNCIKYDFYREKLLPFAKEERISVEAYIARADKYYYNIANKEEQNQYTIHKQNSIGVRNASVYYMKKCSNVSEMIDNILKLDVIEDKIKYIIQECHYHNILDFKDDINCYYINKDKEKLKAIVNLYGPLNDYYEKLKDIKSNIAKEKRQLKKIQKLNEFKDKILNLIKNNTFDLDKYIIEEKTTLKWFNEKLLQIKETDFENYKIIYNYLNIKSLKNDKVLLEDAKKLSIALKNGVIINGEQTVLTLLDYYFITKADLYNMQCILDKYEFDTETIRLFNVFRKKYMVNINLIVEVELNGHRFIMKNGKQEEITNEEKLETIEYLKNHNIPINNFTYSVAIRRKAQNVLDNNIELGNSILNQKRIPSKVYKIRKGN